MMVKAKFGYIYAIYVQNILVLVLLNVKKLIKTTQLFYLVQFYI